MRHPRTRSAVRVAHVVLGVGLLAGLLATPAAAGGTTRFVDDDGLAGPGCDSGAVASQTIEDALSESSPGDTIRVCPGTYVGKLVVALPRLTIEATTPLAAVVTVPAASVAGVPTGSEPLITIVDADDVTIEGLSLRIPAPDAATAGGFECLLAAAIRVEEDSDRVAILRNRIRAVGPGTLGPCGYENGIEVIGGSNGRAVGNVVRDFAGEGIVASGPGTRLRMASNDIRFWHQGEGIPKLAGADGSCTYGAGLVLSSGAVGVLEDNKVVGLATAGESTPMLCPGIYLHQAGDDVVVRGNLLRYVYDTVFIVNTRRFELDDNRVLDSRNNGITLGGVRNAKVRDNVVRRSGGRGIDVKPDLVARADLPRFLRGAVPAGGAATRNVTFRRNDSFDNDGRDCKDASSGTRTLGTANTWIDNDSDGNDLPNGLCP